MMIQKLSPPGTTDAPVRDPKRIEKKIKGTNIDNAVVLEKEKQQKQKRDQYQPFERPQHEVPLEIYNSDASAEPLGIDESGVDIVA